MEKAKRFLPVVAGVLLSATLVTLHFKASQRLDLPKILGNRAEAIFDLWSLQHFSSGVLAGAFFVYAKAPSVLSWQKTIFLALSFALTWEAAELAMEAGWLGLAVANWKGGYEHWSNRFVGDPSVCVFGSLLARKFKIAWKVVLLPAALWLIANVVSPHSMYVQQLVFGK